MHVDRLVNANDFIRRCKDLNVEVSLGELEQYEKIGAMMPVARVVYPDEYVIRQYRSERDGETDWAWLAEWPSIPVFGGKGSDLPARLQRPSG